MDPITLALLGIEGYNALNDVAYNLENKASNNSIYDEAVRGTAQDRHVLNQLGDFLLTGNGLWGQSSADKELQRGLDYARNSVGDFSNVRNNQNLLNSWNSNMLQQNVTSNNLNFDQSVRANTLNKAINDANRQTITNFYDAANQNNQRQLRQNMMNYFDDGGDLGNGITSFNTGGSHAENPNNGILQGIAADGLPNKVEEGEVKFNDYIYSARLKPSKKLLKDNNLPEKYYGLTYAKLAEKLQKESEARPNDPISKQTLEAWMSRLQNAQEQHKHQLEERELAKQFDNLSNEEKAGLVALAQEQMMQQPDIQDISQDDMQPNLGLEQLSYAKGGSIHINPKNKGKWHKGQLGLSLNIPQTFNTSAIPNKALYNIITGNDPKVEFTPKGYESELRPGFQTNLLDPNYKIGGDSFIAPRLIGTNNSESKNEPYKFDPEDLRYAPIVGSALGALKSSLQPVDYRLADDLNRMSSEIQPIAAPTVGGYRRYNPYDVNLGDAENLATQAAAIRANRGLNRATQGALNTAALNANQKNNAARNLVMQQANQASREAIDKYNLGIDQINANLGHAYDTLNSKRLLQRLNTEKAALEAADAARTGWSQSYNDTITNMYDQLGNLGKDEWSNNQLMKYLKAFGKEGILKIK